MENPISVVCDLLQQRLRAAIAKPRPGPMFSDITPKGLAILMSLPLQ